MLKIVYPICCGMDVHKSFLVACIASTNEQGVTTYQSKRFFTFTGDLRRCAAWLGENDRKDVCMESTGKYWGLIYNILEAPRTIVLAHPKYVKAIRGKKTDKKDAKWIAAIFKHDLVSGSFILPADIRQLRDLMCYRWKLTNFTTGEKNRAQNVITANILGTTVYSDAGLGILAVVIGGIRDIDLWLGLQNLAASHFHRPALVDQVCTLQLIYIIFYSRSGYTAQLLSDGSEGDDLRGDVAEIEKATLQLGSTPDIVEGRQIPLEYLVHHILTHDLLGHQIIGGHRANSGKPPT